MSRYSRQIVLQEIGLAGQEKLLNASVLCVGAGGLGSPALLYLAAAGVGRIGIVDFDVVDKTNLQRQTLFTTEQIGESKAQAAKLRLESLNPEIEIRAYVEELNQDNAQSLFKNYDIIIDAVDNFSTKFLINDAGIKIGKPVIYGAISGYDGFVSVFGARNGPCYRCLISKSPSGHIQNCAEAGVIGAVAGNVGTVQAMEAIKLILNHENFTLLVGKVWMIDMQSMQSKVLSLAKDPKCPTCSKEKNEIILSYSSPICKNIQEATFEQVEKNADAIIIDVRELEEWEAGHIEEARHLPLSILEKQERIFDFPKSSEIFLYCHSGKRSKKALEIITAKGYSNSYSLIGGYQAWLESQTL